MEQIGIVDLLVNNAAITFDGKFIDAGLQQLDDIINTNCKSVFNISQVVAHGLIGAGRHGSIVNMSSTWGINPKA